MSKLKTVKGVKRRFKVTGSGRIVGFRAGRRHLLHGKRAKVKRQLRGSRPISRADERKLRILLPCA